MERRKLLAAAGAGLALAARRMTGASVESAAGPETIVLRLPEMKCIPDNHDPESLEGYMAWKRNADAYNFMSHLKVSRELYRMLPDLVSAERVQLSEELLDIWAGTAPFPFDEPCCGFGEEIFEPDYEEQAREWALGCLEDRKSPASTKPEESDDEEEDVRSPAEKLESLRRTRALFEDTLVDLDQQIASAAAAV